MPSAKVLEQKKTLNAGTPSDGGFTVPLAFSGEYIDALVATTLIDKLNIRRVPLIHGNLSIPRMDATSSVSWVGETTSGGGTQPVFGEVNMRAKKLKAITAISNTLLNESGVNLEGWIADDLMRKARITLDEAMQKAESASLTLAPTPNACKYGCSTNVAFFSPHSSASNA